MNITSWILLVIALILTAVLLYIRVKRQGEESQVGVSEEIKPGTIMDDEKGAPDVPENDKAREE